MYNNSAIRSEAFKITKGNLGKLLGLMLFVMIVPSVVMAGISLPVVLAGGAPSFVALLLLYLACLIVMPPLTMGGSRMILGLWRGGKLELKEIIYYITDIKRFGKAFLLMLIISLISMGLSLIPIIGSIILIWLSLRISLATWLFVNDDRLTVIECIKFSFELMKGHCWRYFCMMFVNGLIWIGAALVVMVPVMIVGAVFESVAFVILLVPVMLCIAALYMPYYMLSMAGFAAELIVTPSVTQPSTPEL